MGRPAALRLAAVLLGLGVAGIGPWTGGAAAASCLAAQARDPLRACGDSSLAVVPSVVQRAQRLASKCRKIKREPGSTCAFGSRSSHPRATIALLGDSHALHWRGPLAVVARAQRWRAISMWVPLCLFSTAAKYQGSLLRDRCVPWNRAVKAWFRRHREVSTVFISQAAFIPVNAPPGRSSLATKVAGFRRAWRSLPRTVKHIVVIRDVPATASATFDCVAQVVAAGRQPAGSVCREARRDVLRTDPASLAVRYSKDKRVQLADLTRYFCDTAYCYPVVGGALVHRDPNHMTVGYAESLGPYLLRAVRRLSASW